MNLVRQNLSKTKSSKTTGFHKTESSTCQQMCEIQFGIVGFDNSSLTADFFPEDLPEDWRLDFYHNEFNALLVCLTDDNFQYFDALHENIDDDFRLLFDVSSLSGADKSRRVAQSSMKYIIPDTQSQKIPHDSDRLFFMGLVGGETCFQHGVYTLANKKKLAPIVLKNIIEQAHLYAQKYKLDKISIFFSSDKSALSDCRNAILLASLM
jgi:hypothetical protein